MGTKNIFFKKRKGPPSTVAPQFFYRLGSGVVERGGGQLRVNKHRGGAINEGDKKCLLESFSKRSTYYQFKIEHLMFLYIK